MALYAKAQPRFCRILLNVRRLNCNASTTCTKEHCISDPAPFYALTLTSKPCALSTQE